MTFAIRFVTTHIIKGHDITLQIRIGVIKVPSKPVVGSNQAGHHPLVISQQQKGLA